MPAGNTNIEGERRSSQTKNNFDSSNINQSIGGPAAVAMK